MELSEIVALVAEDKRQAVTDALAGVVKITSREDAEKVIKENSFIKSSFDAGISIAVASHDKRFMEEKLPNVIEDELRKRAPKPKDPELANALKIAEDAQKEVQAIRREALIERQTSRAITKASQLGIPAELAAKYIGNSDEETDAAVDSLCGVLKPYMDKTITQGVIARVGNNGMPPAGNVAETTLEAQYGKALSDGNADLALAIQSKMQAQVIRR